jgi:hypothetical protein
LTLKRGRSTASAPTIPITVSLQGYMCSRSGRVRYRPHSILFIVTLASLTVVAWTLRWLFAHATVLVVQGYPPPTLWHKTHPSSVADDVIDVYTCHLRRRHHHADDTRNNGAE